MNLFFKGAAVNVEGIISELGLEKHIEGGYYLSAHFLLEPKSGRWFQTGHGIEHLLSVNPR